MEYKWTDIAIDIKIHLIITITLTIHQNDNTNIKSNKESNFSDLPISEYIFIILSYCASIKKSEFEEEKINDVKPVNLLGYYFYL